MNNHKDGFQAGFKAAIDYIKEDENTVNSLKHAEYSSLLAGLFFILFRLLFTPKYNETKKEYKDMATVGIILNELLYKSFDPATDSFYGPLNIIKYLGEGTDPPIYNVSNKFISDAWKTAFGNKTTGQFITGNFAFARIMKAVANLK